MRLEWAKFGKIVIILRISRGKSAFPDYYVKLASGNFCDFHVC